MNSAQFLVFLFVLSLPIGLWGQQPSVAVCPTPGVVLLRVDFLATGEVGEVKVEKGLPNGLTEQAVGAARKIKFSPKKVDGKAVGVTRQIEYAFDDIFEVGSSDLRSDSIITSKPPPKFPSDLAADRWPSHIDVPVFFTSQGRAELNEFPADFSEQIRKAVRDAVHKIKYKPAVHRCGKPVPQKRTIRYEIKIR